MPPPQNPSPWKPWQRDRLVGHLLDRLLPEPGKPGLSTNDIGDRLKLGAYERNAVLWPELDKLARRGLAERTNPDERRFRCWRLTPAGLAARRTRNSATATERSPRT